MKCVFLLLSYILFVDIIFRFCEQDDENQQTTVGEVYEKIKKKNKCMELEVSKIKNEKWRLDFASPSLNNSSFIILYCRFIKQCAWLIVVIQSLLIIASRKHYTVDIVVAWY